jgi:uncharacterized membrane protein YdcZ (DUF606 family)
MNKKNLLKFSWITFAIGLFVLAVAYFFFHFVTDEGIQFIWQPEVEKWYVTILIGMFGVLFVFASAISLLSALLFFKTEEDLSK